MKTLAPFRVFLAVLALALVALYAPAAAPRPAATGHLSGALLDGATHEAIPRANVVLLRAADGRYVATAATRPDGTFEFRDLPFGQYRLQPTVLGYEPLHPLVDVSARRPRLALGRVELRPLNSAAPLASRRRLTPTAPASARTKVGNAGRFVLASAGAFRQAAARRVQL